MFLSVKEMELRKVRFDETFEPGQIDFTGEDLEQNSALRAAGVAELLAHFFHLVDALVEKANLAARGAHQSAQSAHQGSLAAARRNVQAAGQGLRQGVPLELVAFDVTEALQQIAEILGESCTGEVLDRIFSSFCVGK